MSTTVSVVITIIVVALVAGFLIRGVVKRRNERSAEKVSAFNRSIDEDSAPQFAKGGPVTPKNFEPAETGDISRHRARGDRRDRDDDVAVGAGAVVVGSVDTFDEGTSVYDSTESADSDGDGTPDVYDPDTYATPESTPEPPAAPEWPSGAPWADQPAVADPGPSQSYSAPEPAPAPSYDPPSYSSPSYDSGSSSSSYDSGSSGGSSGGDSGGGGGSF